MATTCPGRIPVLTYHSQNIAGNDYARNDRCAMERDLDILAGLGLRIVPLDQVVRWVRGEVEPNALAGTVAVTCDDGPLFDFEDRPYRTFGLQKSVRRIVRERGGHVTLFVLASDQARSEIGASALGDPGLMSNHWWRQAEAEGWAAVESHGWDHCHPAVSKPAGDPGHFLAVDNRDRCRRQVAEAAEQIAAVSGRRPTLFAYPFGQSSDYLRDHYLPGNLDDHGMQAAVTTEPDYVQAGSTVWNLPRFVCGRDWRSPQAFESLMATALRSWD